MLEEPGFLLSQQEDGAASVREAIERRTSLVAPGRGSTGMSPLAGTVAP